MKKVFYNPTVNFQKKQLMARQALQFIYDFES